MFVFAHLSDPHLGPVPIPNPHQLLGKRLTSYLAWLLRNRWYHDADLLEGLLVDLRQFTPEHVLVSGDLTNIALPQEFARARAWLEALGDAMDVTVVPGNHDACVAVPWQDSLACWSDFMSGGPTVDSEELPALSLEDFPFVRRRGPVAFIGLNSAVPRPLTRTPAAGVLGTSQIARLKTALKELRSERLFRVVVIHHAPHIGLSPRKALLDAGEFARAVEEEGAELVLHGHLHQSDFEETKGPSGPVPVIGVPSASGLGHHGKPRARFHVFGVAGSPGFWRLDILVREAEASGVGFRTEREFRLSLGQGGLNTGRSFKEVVESAHVKLDRGSAPWRAPLPGARR